MLEKLQKFGAAMITPVLLFSFAGLVLAFALTLNNPLIVGSIATEGTVWYNFWKIIESGAWTVFTQMELLFLIGVVIGLTKVASGRAAMEALIIYLTFNYFVNGILTYFGDFFSTDISQGVVAGSGLKEIAGIITLDTGIMGSITVALITVFLHNKFFNKKLPDILGVFQGSTLVVIIGFVVMIPFALLIVLIWPQVQQLVASLQDFMIASKSIGVFIYTFLERSLIPTGLHHFIYQPFMFGPAVVEQGIKAHWVENLSTFAQSTEALATQFPAGGFSLYGNSKVFGSIGIAISFFLTSKPEKRKRLLALLIPATLTAVLTGITEPLEFTFLFIAPILFFIHALLAASMSTLMYSFGVVGDFSNGLIEYISLNWIPMFPNHVNVMVIQLVIGLVFIAIYVSVFRYAILKFNFLTPGREINTEETKLYSKLDLKNQTSKGKTGGNNSEYFGVAKYYLHALGGEENIKSVINCATRLRVTTVDPSLVQNSNHFKEGGAHGLVCSGNSFQIIIGLHVPQVRIAFEEIIEIERGKKQ